MQSVVGVEGNIAKLPASLGIIFRGPYGELCQLLERIEMVLPTNVRVLYKRFSPGGLWIVQEGVVSE